MFFSNYREHQHARVRKSLLWEYDTENFDWKSLRNIVVRRVIERGRLEDFYAILNLYGWEGVREGIKQLNYLSERDIAFVCAVFRIKKADLTCCTRKQSAP